MGVWVGRYRRLVGVTVWGRRGACLGRGGGSRGGEGISLAIGGRGRFGLVSFAPALLAVVGVVATTFAVRDAAICEEREAGRQGACHH